MRPVRTGRTARAPACVGASHLGVHDATAGGNLHPEREEVCVMSFRLASLVALTVVLTAVSGGSTSAQTADAAELKAAYLLNFTKFSEWPNVPAESPLVLCVLGDPSVSRELSNLVRGQRVNNHKLKVLKLSDGEAVKPCHVLYIAAAATTAAGPALGGASEMPILTVSDRGGFADSTGTIELYVERDRMRFAINVDAIRRSQVRVSSRLLAMARIVRDKDTR